MVWSSAMRFHYNLSHWDFMMILWDAHFTDEQIKAQRGKAIWKVPQLISAWVRSVRLKSAWEVREASQRRQLLMRLGGGVGDGQEEKLRGVGEEDSISVGRNQLKLSNFKERGGWVLPFTPSPPPMPQSYLPQLQNLPRIFIPTWKPVSS